MAAETTFEPSNVNVRIKLSALWTSMLFVFAYVDLFSLYQPDVPGRPRGRRGRRVHR
jgi:hypothetical protein